MKDKELIEILTRNIDFIKQADSKAAYASTVLFLVVGFLISKSSLYTDHTESLACFVLLLIFAAGITFIIFKSIFPTVKNSLSRDSNIYFGSIASKSFKEFKKQADGMKAKDYRSELLGQVYVTSEIAEAKMANVKKSIFWLMLFVVLAGVATVIVKYY